MTEKKEIKPASESKRPWTFEDECNYLRNHPNVDYDEADDGTGVVIAGGQDPKVVKKHSKRR